jgi:hypothetical protein
MDTPQQRLRKDWAKRFPEISDDWPYWWIQGDNYCLAVIDGANLAAAIDIVDDNWERFTSIKAHNAKRIDSDLMRSGKGNYEISNRECSKKALERYESEAQSLIEA